MGAARKGLETNWSRLNVSGCQLELGAPGKGFSRYPKFNAAHNRCGSRPRIRNSRGAGRFWSSSGAGRARGIWWSIGAGRARGRALPARGALEKARRAWSSIGSVRARGRALAEETVGGLLARLGGFGSPSELGASGVGLFAQKRSGTIERLNGLFYSKFKPAQNWCGNLPKRLGNRLESS